jgi:hypothetical protein
MKKFILGIFLAIVSLMPITKGYSGFSQKVKAEELYYELPWTDGTSASVSRSYVAHGAGQIDFLLSNDDVRAVKDGTVIYANDTHTITSYGLISNAWRYNNAVIIKHNDTEYSAYYHIGNNSIPSSIKNTCTTNYSTSNCNYSVKAGELIGLESNTGNATGIHLHVEFGTNYGISGYNDGLDEDGDSNYSELVHSAYLSGLHNVGFQSGSTFYTSANVGSWYYGQSITATHNYWYINSDTNINTTKVYNGEVNVKGGATLTIQNGGVLDMDFTNKKMVINSDSRVIIEPQGKLF